MRFEVRMGIPEMRDLWNRLEAGARQGTLTAKEKTLAKKFAKAVKHLQANPFHPGLSSHEIDDLTKRYGQKVFESYLENNTPGAGRLFWVYGPERGQISMIGLEPHPEDAKSGAYKRIRLSELPKTKKEEAEERAAKEAAKSKGAAHLGTRSPAKRPRGKR